MPCTASQQQQQCGRSEQQRVECQARESAALCLWHTGERALGRCENFSLLEGSCYCCCCNVLVSNRKLLTAGRSRWRCCSRAGAAVAVSVFLSAIIINNCKANKMAQIILANNGVNAVSNNNSNNNGCIEENESKLNINSNWNYFLATS